MFSIFKGHQIEMAVSKNKLHFKISNWKIMSLLHGNETI